MYDASGEFLKTNIKNSPINIVEYKAICAISLFLYFCKMFFNIIIYF